MLAYALCLYVIFGHICLERQTLPTDLQYFFKNLLLLQGGPLFHMRFTFFHYFLDPSNFDSHPIRPRNIFLYFAYNSLPPLIPEKIIRDVWIAPN